MVAEDGDKYELVAGRGLRVNRLEVWDNGTYECRAEVASHGNVKLRHIHLEVLCKNTLQSHDFHSSSSTNCCVSVRIITRKLRDRVRINSAHWQITLFAGTVSFVCTPQSSKFSLGRFSFRFRSCYSRVCLCKSAQRLLFTSTRLFTCADYLIEAVLYICLL